MANAEGRLWFLQDFDLNFRRRRWLLFDASTRPIAGCLDQARLRPLLDQVKQGLFGLIRMLRNVQSGRWVKDRGRT